MNTGASASRLQKDGSRKKPPRGAVDGTPNAAGANALGLKAEEKENAGADVVVVRAEDTWGVGVGFGSSLLPNIEVPVENAEPDIVNGAVPGEKGVEVGV